MTIDLNTSLLLIVIAILVFVAFKKSHVPAPHGGPASEGDMRALQSKRQSAVPPVVNAEIVLAPDAENSAALSELFEVEEISSKKITVSERSGDAATESAALHIFGEFIKGAGNFKQAGKTFKICFKPEVERGLRDGTYELMQRLSGGRQVTAVNSFGKKTIAGNGWIESARADRLMALTSLAWQGMAIITAQKFLSDINKSMKEIRSSVEDLKHLHDAEIEGRLIGWQSYVQQAAERLSGGVNDMERLAIATQLEQIHRLSLEEYFASEDRLNRSVNELCAALKDKTANEKTVREADGKCAAVQKEVSRLLGFARISVANVLALNMRLDFRAEIGLADSHKLLEDSLGVVVKGLDRALGIVKSLPDAWISWGGDSPSKVRKDIQGQIRCLRDEFQEQQARQLKIISSARDRLGKSQALYFRVGNMGQIEHIKPSGT